MRVGIRVQHDDAEAVLPVRRQHQGKDFGPELRQGIGEEGLCRVGEPGHLLQMRLQEFFESPAHMVPCPVHDPNAVTLQLLHGGQSAKLA
jgi:hypothetical protein